MVPLLLVASAASDPRFCTYASPETSDHWALALAFTITYQVCAAANALLGKTKPSPTVPARSDLYAASVSDVGSVFCFK